MNFRAKPDPLFLYLIRYQPETKLPDLIKYTAYIMGGSVLCVPMSFLMSLGMIFVEIPIALVGLSSAVLVPILITIYAWRIARQTLQNRSDELLFLTNLSSAAIVWAYAGAALYRWRRFHWAIMALLPVTLFEIGVSALLIQVGFDRTSWCLDLPLGIHYCSSPPNQDESTGSDKLGIWLLQIITAGIGVGIGSFGVHLLAALAGTVIAHRFRDSLYAAILAIILYSSTAVVWLIFIAELSYKAAFSYVPSDTFKVAFLFAITPCILALLTAKLCERWIRRPT